MFFGEPIKPCDDCVDGHCTMNCSTPMKPVKIVDPARFDVETALRVLEDHDMLEEADTLRKRANI